MGATKGMLIAGPLRFPCILGRSGRTHGKREGDGATPVGRWTLSRVLYRRDRALPPRSKLLTKVIRASDGWCDQAFDRNYNRPVRLPYPARHEEMIRADHLYDIVVVLSHNQCPRIRGRGSAVFLHLADPQGRPTAGCIALSWHHMATVLSVCGGQTGLVVWPVREKPTPCSRKSPSRRGRRWRRKR